MAYHIFIGGAIVFFLLSGASLVALAGVIPEWRRRQKREKALSVIRAVVSGCEVPSQAQVEQACRVCGIQYHSDWRGWFD